jgi:O-antigen/teichoic acid export membrane protein
MRAVVSRERFRSGSALGDVLSTAVTNGAVTVGAALGGVVVARALGPEGRGTFAAVMAWFVVVQVVAEGGVQGATAFYAARVRTDRKDLIRRSSTMLAAQGLAVASIALGLVWWVDVPRAFLWAFAVVAAGLAPVLLLSASLFSLQGMRIGVWNLARTTQVPVYVGVLALFWLGDRLTPTGAAFAVAFSNIVSGVVAFVLARRIVSAGVRGEDRVSTGRIYRFAAPNLAWTLPGIVSSRLDQLSLSILAPASDLGQYAVALTMTALSVPVVAAIGNVLMPSLSRQASEGRSPGAVGRRAVAWTAVLASLVAGVVVVLAPWVVPVLFGPGFDQVPRLSWLLVPATVLYATGRVAADVLRGMGRPGAAAAAEWAGLSVNIVAVPVAVMLLGTPGAALAPALGFSMALLIMFRGLAPTRHPAAAVQA